MAPFHQGDIVRFDFSPTSGHEPAGTRPALVVGSDNYQRMTSLTLVCPITTRDNGFPLHLRLPEGLETWGFVDVEQVRSVDLLARNGAYVESIDCSSPFMTQVITLVRSFF